MIGVTKFRIRTEKILAWIHQTFPGKGYDALCPWDLG
jgi:hypothetical protein